MVCSTFLFTGVFEAGCLLKNTYRASSSPVSDENMSTQESDDLNYYDEEKQRAKGMVSEKGRKQRDAFKNGRGTDSTKRILLT